jgi:hypothetical protein
VRGNHLPPLGEDVIIFDKPGVFRAVSAISWADGSCARHSATKIEGARAARRRAITTALAKSFDAVMGGIVVRAAPRGIERN